MAELEQALKKIATTAVHGGINLTGMIILSTIAILTNDYETINSIYTVVF